MWSSQPERHDAFHRWARCGARLAIAMDEPRRRAAQRRPALLLPARWQRETHPGESSLRQATRTKLQLPSLHRRARAVKRPPRNHRPNHRPNHRAQTTAQTKSAHACCALASSRAHCPLRTLTLPTGARTNPSRAAALGAICAPVPSAAAHLTASGCALTDVCAAKHRGGRRAAVGLWRRLLGRSRRLGTISRREEGRVAIPQMRHGGTAGGSSS